MMPGAATENGVTRRTPQTVVRSRVLDGVRGLAIVLVVLSHSWKVFSAEDRGDLGPFKALFDAGSVAVSIFFVLSGFLVTRSLVRAQRQHGPLGSLHWFSRRVVRITLQLWLLLAAVAVMARVDPTDQVPPAFTERSLVTAATYQWNTYVRDHALEARSDIGAVYFLAIDLQFFVVWVLVLLVLSRWPKVLAGLTAVAVVVFSVIRWEIFQLDGWFHATLTTIARADAILWGALAALLAGHGARLRARAGQLLTAAALAMFGVIALCGFVGLEAYFSYQGPMIGAATALLVWADQQPERVPDTSADVLFGLHPLQVLGRASLTIFLWHIPVFEAVARHLPDSTPSWRTVVALLILGGLAWAVEVAVAQPLDRLAHRLVPGRTPPRHSRLP